MPEPRAGVESGAVALQTSEALVAHRPPNSICVRHEKAERQPGQSRQPCELEPDRERDRPAQRSREREPRPPDAQSPAGRRREEEREEQQVRHAEVRRAVLVRRRGQGIYDVKFANNHGNVIVGNVSGNAAGTLGWGRNPDGSFTVYLTQAGTSGLVDSAFVVTLL